MHFSSLFIAASASLLSIASAGQVNFYSDTNCKNYIGSSYPGSYQTIGYVRTNKPPRISLGFLAQFIRFPSLHYLGQIQN